MKRYLGMNIMRAMLLAIALVAAACGGEKSVASKSAAAYRDAQAKGIPVGGGHEHGGHAATGATAGADHSAHGATTTGGAAMDHSAHGTGADAHAGMNHGTTTGGAMDHGAHGGAGTVDHAAMGHSTGATNAHAGHGMTGGTTTSDHAAMGHGTSRSTNAHAGHTATTDAHAGHGATAAPANAHAGHTAPAAAADPHAQHGAQPATAQMDHSRHGAMQRPAAAGANAHAQHGGAATSLPEVAPAPRSNAEMQRVQPAATLRRDAFDAPAAVSVSEAARAARGGGGHEGHGTRGITAGEDRENPPTPMPATRDGSSRPPAADHSQHGATAQPATLYACPMHPEVTSDMPGTCPKCGMTLVKQNG